MAEKRARVRSVRTLAPEVLLIDLEMVDPPELRYRAGQFVSVRIDERGDVRRSYSIASPPDRSDGFELLVKLVPEGVGSRYFRPLRAGTEVGFTGPMGFFTPEPGHLGDAVFAATGSGIAAALPMIHEVLGRPHEQSRVLLFWGVRRADDVYFRDRLEAEWARSERFGFHICLSRPDPGWEGVTGRITGHVLAALPELDRPVFYLVGNGDMIRELRARLVERGVDPRRQIRTEVFYPAREP